MKNKTLNIVWTISIIMGMFLIVLLTSSIANALEFKVNTNYCNWINGNYQSCNISVGFHSSTNSTLYSGYLCSYTDYYSNGTRLTAYANMTETGNTSIYNYNFTGRGTLGLYNSAVNCTSNVENATSFNSYWVVSELASKLLANTEQNTTWIASSHNNSIICHTRETTGSCLGDKVHAEWHCEDLTGNNLSISALSGCNVAKYTAGGNRVNITNAQITTILEDEGHGVAIWVNTGGQTIGLPYEIQCFGNVTKKTGDLLKNFPFEAHFAFQAPCEVLNILTNGTAINTTSYAEIMNISRMVNNVYLDTQYIRKIADAIMGNITAINTNITWLRVNTATQSNITSISNKLNGIDGNTTDIYSRVLSLNSSQIPLIQTDTSNIFNDTSWLKGAFNCTLPYDNIVCIRLNNISNYALNINNTLNNVWGWNSTIYGMSLNISKLRDKFMRTNATVVNNRTIISTTLNSTSNISIFYTLIIPLKPDYFNYEKLPFRIEYTFFDNNSNCVNQLKYENATPYCKPIIVYGSGGINNYTNITVQLKPSLPAGTFTMWEEIYIDPANIWIKYSGEPVAVVNVENTKSMNYKLIISIILMLSTIMSLIFLYRKLTRNPKTPKNIEKVFISMLLLVVLGIVFTQITYGAGYSTEITSSYLISNISTIPNSYSSSTAVGVSKSTTFTINSTGNKTLTISNITTPSKTTLDWYSATIPNNSTKTLTLTFDTNVKGTIAGNINISSDALNTPYKNISISLEVYEPSMISPQSAIVPEPYLSRIETIMPSKILLNEYNTIYINTYDQYSNYLNVSIDKIKFYDKEGNELDFINTTQIGSGQYKSLYQPLSLGTMSLTIKTLLSDSINSTQSFEVVEKEIVVEDKNKNILEKLEENRKLVIYTLIGGGILLLVLLFILLIRWEYLKRKRKKPITKSYISYK